MPGVAVFGAGRIGRIHAGNLYRIPGVQVRHVCDVVREAAEELAAECDARVSEIDVALSDDQVDAVVVATSTDTHAELVHAAAKAGKAIFCEKPLDLDVATAQESMEAARRQGVLLCLGFNRRHDPGFSRIRQGIEAGEVGRVEVISITSRDPAPPPVDYLSRSGGLYRDMMIHDFDMARWLLGEEPVRVYASGSVLVDEAIGRAGDIDTAMALLTTASGRCCQITNSRRCSYGYDQRVEVFGSEGMLSAGNERATEVEAADRSGYHREAALPFFLERYARAYEIQLKKFMRAVQGEAVALPDGHDGVRALQIAEAAEKSMQAGQPVDL